MTRPRLFALAIILAVAAGGCAFDGRRTREPGIDRASHEEIERHHWPPSPPPPIAMAPELGTPPIPEQLLGPRPVEDYIRWALAENRMVRAARLNTLALRERLPQVTALDDPVLTNTIFPSADNGLQTADGFMPWNLLIAQQFPWFGTLALRGKAAELDVRVALAELAATQLDVVADVKRSYFDLRFNQRAEEILLENRRLAEEFLEVARFRLPVGDLQQDVLQAEVAINDVDRELEAVRLGLAEARASLAQQLSISPDAELVALPADPHPPDWERQMDRLHDLALANRPELRGRRSAVARDLVGVELARNRGYPDVTLGFNYGLMTAENAVSPFAMGNDNLGLFVGFNLPIYRGKIDAGVREAHALAAADAELVEAELDGAFREIKDLSSRIEFQRRVLDIFREGNLPRARDSLELASSDYQTGAVGFSAILIAWREVLQIELQIAQAEAELGKALASLERAIGVRLCAPRGAPPGPDFLMPDDEAPPPPDPTAVGPFSRSEDRAAPGVPGPGDLPGAD